ncbi:MAG TPA: glycosyltransferase family 9 protein [Candidatus Omnitrophota bacterium]|nr:glycosyltransferase family 9 protein [Candidatus Omnitrophota bacterium]
MIYSKKKILIVNLGGMGDFLLSCPAVKALREYYQGAEIVLLTLARTKPVAGAFAYFDQIIAFDFSFLGAFKQALTLRRRNFDLVLNMRTLVSCPGALKMAFLFYLIGAKLRAGRDTSGRGFFLDIKAPEDAVGSLPEYEYDLNTVRALGIPAEFSLPRLPVRDEDMAYMDNFLKTRNIDPADMLIGINPFAPWLSKCWPIGNFAALIKALRKEFSCKIVITGSSDEVEKALRLQDLAGAELAIASGETTFGQLAALIKRCSLYITNDTGPMHIAAILQAPLVALFGGGYLKRFDPRNISKKAIVFHKDAHCAPCDKVNCDSMKCLKEITPDEVMAAARSLLGCSR